MTFYIKATEPKPTSVPKTQSQNQSFLRQLIMKTKIFLSVIKQRREGGEEANLFFYVVKQREDDDEDEDETKIILTHHQNREEKITASSC